MPVLAAVLGAAIIFIVLWDGFEAIILPRRVTRRVRLTRMFYRTAWRLWGLWVACTRVARRRERRLSYFGPLSMLLLLIVWATGLVMGFALLQWAAGSQLQGIGQQPGFLTDIYMSGTTFTTLGLGDVTPRAGVSRVLTVIEAGMGFGFLALVIGYLPVLYQSFSRRELSVALLDARAGSPSTAGELLRRHARAQNPAVLEELFREWERWAADLLESHISYPVLCYFRSQHDNQSWLAALTTVLDTCATVVAGVDGVPLWQAKLTLAMGRHAVVDMAQVLNTPPHPLEPDRLPPEARAQLLRALADEGWEVTERAAFERRLAEARRLYEPYVAALSDYLRLSIPAWMPAGPVVDNWQTSAWERRSTGIPRSVFEVSEDEHA